MVRRLIHTIALALLAISAGVQAGRAAYPDRPVHLVVPTAAGGTADIFARILGQKLGEEWGQSVIIENKAGGLGVIGTDAIAKAAPDGYTIGILPSNHAINPLFVKNLPYDSFHDFAPIGMIAVSPGLLVVNKSQLDVPDLQSAIAAARANPGKYDYASPVPLTNGHRSMEMLKSRAGIDIQHIPYNGGAPAVNDLLAGHVQFLIIAAPSVMSHVAAGRLRALAVTSPERFPGLPDIPTIAESGFPGFDSVEWYGLFTRSGTPPAVIEKLSASLHALLIRPETRTRFEELGATPGTGGPAELQAVLQGEYERWHDLAGKIDLHAD